MAALKAAVAMTPAGAVDMDRWQAAEGERILRAGGGVEVDGWEGRVALVGDAAAGAVGLMGDAWAVRSAAGLALRGSGRDGTR